MSQQSRNDNGNGRHLIGVWRLDGAPPQLFTVLPNIGLRDFDKTGRRPSFVCLHRGTRFVFKVAQSILFRSSMVSPSRQFVFGRETSAGTFNRSYLEDALLHNKGEPDRSGPGMLFSSKIKADLGGAASAPPRKGRRVSTTYPTDAQRSQKNKKNKK